MFSPLARDVTYPVPAYLSAISSHQREFLFDQPPRPRTADSSHSRRSLYPPVRARAEMCRPGGSGDSYGALGTHIGVFARRRRVQDSNAVDAINTDASQPAADSPAYRLQRPNDSELVRGLCVPVSSSASVVSVFAPSPEVDTAAHRPLASATSSSALAESCRPARYRLHPRHGALLQSRIASAAFHTMYITHPQYPEEYVNLIIVTMDGATHHCRAPLYMSPGRAPPQVEHHDPCLPTCSYSRRVVWSHAIEGWHWLCGNTELFAI
ncbi:hypothetical protein C8Q76DRAFT_726898 [Earliella scabrosa]|nr:hypothetical protein C8Q76DRAFT_726898 [Earliella scabrosa]